MNWLDIVLLILVAASTAGGLLKGFTRLVIGLAAALIGLFCALWFYGAAGSLLEPYVSHKAIASFIGFLLVFTGTILAGAVLGKLLGLLLKWAGLSWLDRLAGGAFGLIRGAVIGIALVLALMAFSPKPPPRAVVRSRLAPYFIDAAHICAALAPREVREAVEESYSKIRDAWDQLLHALQTG